MQDYLPISAIKRHSFLQQRSPYLIGDKYDFNRQRANLSSTINDVKSALNNGNKIKVPLEVHEVDHEYLLVDGHHRYDGALAHCKENKKDHNVFLVPVNITKESTLQAAIDASFKVNLDHGVGLTAAELKHLHFRRYVWNRSIPTIKEIMAEASCSKGTASNIANAAKWCLGVIKYSKHKIDTPDKLATFMTKQMETLGISSGRLDNYGLPSYSLLRKALKGEDIVIDVIDSRKEHIQDVAEHLEYLEGKYGVEVLREGIRKYKTAAHGIIVSQHSKWISKDSTASLLAIELYSLDEDGF